MQELMKLGSALAGCCCLLVLLAALPSGSATSVGYDCSHNASEIVPLNVDQVFSSPGAADNRRIVTKVGQLIQTRQEVKIKVHSCKVDRRIEVHRQRFTKPVSVITSPHLLGKEECEQLHATEKLTLGEDVIVVMQNATTVKVLIKAGTMEDDGSWTGGEFYHEGEKYSNVLVTETVSIDLGELQGVARPDQTTLSLSRRAAFPYGTDPDYSAGYYFDRETSTTMVWDTGIISNFDSCMSDWYDVIYEGPINVVNYINDFMGGTTFILIPFGDQIVALKSWGNQGEKCGFSQWSTEGNLMVVEKDQDLGYMVQSSEKNPNIETGIPDDPADLMKSKAVFRTVSPERKLAILQKLIDPFRSRTLLLSDYPDSRVVVVQPRPNAAPVQGQYNTGSSQGYYLNCKRVSVTPRTEEICKQYEPVTYNDEPWYLVKPSLLLTKNALHCPKA